MVSQTSRKYSNEFLNIGVDASALGMSNAVVASTNDVNSGYWNPAGLVHIEDSEIDWQAKTINKLSRITKEKVLSLKECLKLWEAVDFLLFAKKTEPELWIKIYRKLENDRQQ